MFGQWKSSWQQVQVWVQSPCGLCSVSSPTLVTFFSLLHCQIKATRALNWTALISNDLYSKETYWLKFCQQKYFRTNKQIHYILSLLLRLFIYLSSISGCVLKVSYCSCFVGQHDHLLIRYWNSEFVWLRSCNEYLICLKLENGLSETVPECCECKYTKLSKQIYIRSVGEYFVLCFVKFCRIHNGSLRLQVITTSKHCTFLLDSSLSREATARENAVDHWSFYI